MNRLGSTFKALLKISIFSGFLVSVFGLSAFAEQPNPKRSPYSSKHLMDDLRATGKRLDLSSSYEPSMRIDSPDLSSLNRLGNCDFYQNFLNLLGVENAKAVEAKIRGLSIEEANRFILRYGERLQDQNKLTPEIADKLEFFQSQIRDSKIAEAHCHAPKAD